VSVVFAGGVASLYVAAVVGIHRLKVYQRRAAAGGFPTLQWLDWDELLKGLLPDAAEPEVAGSPDPVTAFALPPMIGGGPVPRTLRAAAGRAPEDLKVLVVAELLGGGYADVLEPKINAAGYSGGQARWLKTLALARHDPHRAIERLESGTLDSAQELYLREYLRLVHRTHPLNLELAVFSAKRRLAHGLTRFGEVPALFFARALASARLGLNQAAIDDLARAVYFSRRSDFYIRAVLDWPYIEEARPALLFQCRQSLDQRAAVG
jgi:hypothetical protein